MNYQSDPIQGLISGDLHHFGNWPCLALPQAAAGVYSIWRGSELVYVGMAGRGWKAGEAERRAGIGGSLHGLALRLHSHASGRRSGDQFCMYVCDRFVVPNLTSQRLQELRDGRPVLDALTREFIRNELSFRFVLAADGLTALQVETVACIEGLGGVRPLLNPHAPRQTGKPKVL